MGDAILNTITYMILIIFMIGFGVIITIGLYKFINEDMLGNKPKKDFKPYIIKGINVEEVLDESGEVNESTGHVSGFDIITVDIVAQPSAPHAYPKAIYEGLMNMRHGHRVLDVARDATQDQRVQKYLKEGITRLIRDLKL